MNFDDWFALQGQDEEELEEVKCSGDGCDRWGVPNYNSYPKTGSHPPDEFYCGGSPRCCP